jgi:hypothetical protein
MSYYAVIREAGAGWTEGGIAAQPDLAQHAAFMNERAEEASSCSPGRSPGPRNHACALC